MLNLKFIRIERYSTEWKFILGNASVISSQWFSMDLKSWVLVVVPFLLFHQYQGTMLLHLDAYI